MEGFRRGQVKTKDNLNFADIMTGACVDEPSDAVLGSPDNHPITDREVVPNVVVDSGDLVCGLCVIVETDKEDVNVAGKPGCEGVGDDFVSDVNRETLENKATGDDTVIPLKVFENGGRQDIELVDEVFERMSAEGGMTRGPEFLRSDGIVAKSDGIDLSCEMFAVILRSFREDIVNACKRVLDIGRISVGSKKSSKDVFSINEIAVELSELLFSFELGAKLTNETGNLIKGSVFEDPGNHLLRCVEDTTSAILENVTEVEV